MRRIIIKALVTGGSGFVGKEIISILREKGIAPLNYDIREGFDILDTQTLNDRLRDIDQVFHCVASVPINKESFEEINVQGTRNLLEAAKVNHVKKVILISSSAVYGFPKEVPLNEESALTPFEAYGKSKLKAERLCDEYPDLDITIIRPRTVLGPGRLGLFHILFDWIEKGKRIPVLDKGMNSYQFIHVKDLALACYLAAQKKGSSVYNCGAKNYGTLSEGLTQLCSHAQTGSKLISFPGFLFEKIMLLTQFISPLSPYHAIMFRRNIYFDTRKIQEELNWHSEFSNTQMLIESYEWYLKNKDHSGSPHQSPLKQGILKLFSWFL